MIVDFKYQINQKENKLVYITINEHGAKTVKIIPIRDENGNLTKEYLKEANKKKYTEYFENLKAEKAKAREEAAKAEVKAEVVVEEAKEAEETTEIVAAETTEVEKVDAEIVEPETTDLMVPETKLAVIDYQEAPAELKKKKKFSWKKFLVIAGLVGIGAFVISRFEGCGAKQNDTTVTATPTPGASEDDKVVEDEEDLKVSPTPTPIEIPTVEEQLEDTRYTEITTEAFEETVFNLQQELTNHGINLDGKDVMTFVALANFTHMNETNPELLKTIMGEDVDPQQVITKAAQVIGQTVYLEVTDKNEQVNWTIALMDAKDKKIADNYMNNVVYAAKEYAEGEPIIEGGTYATREEKRIYIETLVAEGYIVKDFDKTVDVQEIGADFVTDAIVTGILLNDNAIKPFISTQEVVDELTVISANKDAVSNLHSLISTIGCAENAKTLTLN